MDSTTKQAPAVDALDALAVLYEACRDGPPDDSPVYTDTMRRTAEVLSVELGHRMAALDSGKG